MYEKYTELREGLGYLSWSLFLGAFLLSQFLTHQPSEIEQASFTYNLALLLVIVWMCVSGFGKFILLIQEKTLPGLNAAALGLMLIFALLSPTIPLAPLDPNITQTDLYRLYNFVTTAFVLLWIALDISEICYSFFRNRRLAIL